MQGMGNLRLGSRAVMYTAETLPKGKNRVMGTIQIMTGFMHIGFGIVLTTLTNVYTSVFVIGEIPFLGGVSFIISGCLSIGAEKSPTECAVKGSQTMNVISAIFALLGIVAFIVDLNLNGLYRSSFNYYSYLVLLAGNGISIVLLIFTILEFCIAVATANFWCRATRLSSNEGSACFFTPSSSSSPKFISSSSVVAEKKRGVCVRVTWGILGVLLTFIAPQTCVTLLCVYFGWKTRLAASTPAMAATTVTDSGGMRIVTEVIPATDPRAAQLAPGSRPPAPATVSFQVRSFRRAQPKALGTIHIFTGIIHICFGIILTASEHRNPSLPVASGILFWLGLLLLVSGSLLVETEKRDNILLVKTCCVLNAGVILSTLVATLVHTTAIVRDSPGCEAKAPFLLKADWCSSPETKMLSDGLDSIFVLFSLLEFCAAVAALAFGYAAVKQHDYRRMAL
ncbi:uncharacterized protein LOC116961615 isoform X2 [Tyto alba]|uniref:uncharacterized protein LOC116961615 isoform X2 n=1 Tax=Tyto alba TaxID=56313 RepID=UPI001C68589C|nr:uncharacterized protein LOC116961615 isoform X2 [Tyto alba]